MKVSKKIIELREEKGWSQKDLASRIGVHYTSIGRWEREETLPDASDLAKLAQAFGISADYLLFDNAPKDGRININDLHLLRQFEKADLFDEGQKDILKHLIDAFILKANIERDIKESETKTKTKAKR